MKVSQCGIFPSNFSENTMIFGIFWSQVDLEKSTRLDSTQVSRQKSTWLDSSQSTGHTSCQLKHYLYLATLLTNNLNNILFISWYFYIFQNDKLFWSLLTRKNNIDVVFAENIRHAKSVFSCTLDLLHTFLILEAFS